MSSAFSKHLRNVPYIILMHSFLFYNLIMPAFGRIFVTKIKASRYFFAGEEYLAFKPSRISLVMLYTLSAYNRLSNPVLLIIML
ncbi:hypothetical protein EV202_1355 [Bacteroides heparinolyticus]|uniref:Uncharacterized protein n=1 Tax=Prevotella heparinolytica TaxID=28113 RepID=A0A4V2SE59_9BACE|nr:hypothetical protein EV202_1355 [Bacteroides heparinolyticus]